MKEVPSSGYFSGFGALVASGLGKIYIACDPPIDGAGLDLARPVHKEGLANDAFKQGSSFAAISCGGVCPLIASSSNRPQSAKHSTSLKSFEAHSGPAKADSTR